MPTSASPVLELRIAVTTRDYERLVKFYGKGVPRNWQKVAPR